MARKKLAKIQKNIAKIENVFWILARKKLAKIEKNLGKIENYFLDDQAENVDRIFTITGFSFAGQAQNNGMGFVGLKDWSERKRPDQSVFAIFAQAFGALSQVKDATAFTFFPPPIQELGNASGFDFHIVRAPANLR